MVYPRPLIRDISKYDPEIPWNEYDALIIRAFDGTNIDYKFDYHRAKALEYGKPWWPYMFFDFRFPPEPQIPKTLEILGAEDGNQVLAIDVEEWSIYKFPSHDVLLSKMKVLHDSYLNMTGLHPMWYFSSIAVIHEHLIPVPAWLLSDSLWIANWGTYNPEYDPWDTWVIHQYRGEPDLNQFNGTVEQFNDWLITLPEPPQPPTYPDIIINNVGGSYINIRSIPNPYNESYVIGRVYNGKKLRPISMVRGADDKEWWQINEYAYIAKWLTKPA